MAAPARSTARPASSLRTAAGGPLVLGHRGAPGYRPELTRASLLLAIAQGADALEIDVVPTRDGVLILRHDRDLADTTDVARRPALRNRHRQRADGRRAWFADDLDWAEVAALRARERMPRVRPGSAAHDGEEGVLRLPEALEIAAEADVVLVIEIKDAVELAAKGLDPVPMVRADLARAPRLPRIVFESFQKTALLGLADLPFPLVYLLEGAGTAPDEVREGPLARSYRQELADPRALAGFAGLSLPSSRITPRRVAQLHELGLAVWTWTLRPENRFLPTRFRDTGPRAGFGLWEAHWAFLMEAGVDGVFTDHPDLTLAVRRSVAQALQAQPLQAQSR
ncbi:glycerophosphodiester phosphodiesterase [Amnibacterium soli]|uniref:glycerophosphodiester phosphodiesterase n=1 Tax=Amnibacterium soli TaxID=1282736 RepID=A0ABP8Z189_9MICO